MQTKSNADARFLPACNLSLTRYTHSVSCYGKIHAEPCESLIGVDSNVHVTNTSKDNTCHGAFWGFCLSGAPSQAHSHCVETHVCSGHLSHQLQSPAQPATRLVLLPNLQTIICRCRCCCLADLTVLFEPHLMLIVKHGKHSATA